MGRCSSLEGGQSQDAHLGISTKGGIDKPRGPRSEPGHFCSGGQEDDKDNRHRD